VINLKKAILTFGIMLILINTAFAAFGVSVENMETPMSGVDVFFPKMLRDGYAEKVIHLSSSEPGTITSKITVSGDISEWVTFEQGMVVDVPQNTDVKVKMIVNIPETAANGIYNGVVTVLAEPKESSEGSYAMSIVSGVSLRTRIEITGEQIYSFSVSEISVGDTEVGIPIKVSAKIKNEGNVAVKPLVKVTISDNDGKEMLSDEYKETTILASQSDELVFAVPSEKLKEGQYWANVSVYYEDGTLVKEARSTLDVLEKGAFRINGELVQVINKVWAKVGEVVKIDAIFENQGELITAAKFQGEIYLDNTLVKTISSEQLSASPGEKINLTTYFTPEQGGRYVVRGNVVYSEKITETKESIINVNPENAVPLSAAAVGIVGAVIVAGVLGFRFMRKKKDFTLEKKYEL
jgi:hypothetical protein